MRYEPESRWDLIVIDLADGRISVRYKDISVKFAFGFIQAMHHEHRLGKQSYVAAIDTRRKE